jgi:glutamine synthetase
VDTVIVAFPDQFGQLMGKRLTGEFFLKKPEVECCSYLLTTDIEMEPRQGFALGSWEQGYGDFRVVPDFSTLTYPAWLPATALLIGDLEDMDGREVPESPRAVLKAQCQRAEKLGFRPLMASELEFYLFANPSRSVAESGCQGLRLAAPHAIDYHIMGTELNEEVIGEIRRKISASGIPVESSKGETGRGQYEIALEHAPALQMADRHVIYKYGAKAVAAAAGHSVTFMAKVTEKDAGSSCHIHCSLTDAATGANSFWDPDAGKQGLSRTCGCFLGGLQQLANELFLFFAPTVNSYRRYSTGSFAPTRLAWDFDNRTSSFRVVGRDSSFRVENRLPGADANPYLAYAATLAAGLYGIEKKIEPPTRSAGNAYRAEELSAVPESLAEAAGRLNASALARGLLGDRVVEHYVRQARMESAACAAVVGEWELKRYFDRI